MLFEALSQPTIFFALSLGGFLSGFIFDLKNLILFKIKKKSILNQFLLFFSTFFAIFVYFLINLIFNYGQIRFFAIFAFIISFSIQRFLMTNFVANSVIKCYNKLKEKSNGKKKSGEEI